MKKIIIIIFVSIIVKITYFVFAYSLGFTKDINILKRNDSYWYETIAVNGHEKITPDRLGKCDGKNIEQSYYAFFPLYPFTVRVIMKITKLKFDIVAFILSIIISISLFVLFYKYTLLIYNSDKIALLAALFLIVLPFNYYFSTFYTEALYLLLLISSLYSIEKGRTLLFVVFSSALVLVRPNGLFMLFPLFLYYLEKNYTAQVRDYINVILKNIKSLSFFIIPVLVFLLYCVYLKAMTGDFFAYKTAQAGWCRETVFPWVPIFRAEGWRDYFKVIYLIFFFIITIINIKKIPVSFLMIIIINLLLPLVANSITLPRFISVIFIFPILFARYTYKLNKYFIVFMLISLFIIQLYTFNFWLIGDEFSY